MPVDPIFTMIAEALQDAKVIHLQPDDVVVFSGVVMPDGDLAGGVVEGIKGVLGDRHFVLLAPGVTVGACPGVQVAS